MNASSLQFLLFQREMTSFYLPIQRYQNLLLRLWWGMSLSMSMKDRITEGIARLPTRENKYIEKYDYDYVYERKQKKSFDWGTTHTHTVLAPFFFVVVAGVSRMIRYLIRFYIFINSDAMACLCILYFYTMWKQMKTGAWGGEDDKTQWLKWSDFRKLHFYDFLAFLMKLLLRILFSLSLVTTPAPLHVYTCFSLISLAEKCGLCIHSVIIIIAPKYMRQ